jgi:hypothetical protein
MKNNEKGLLVLLYSNHVGSIKNICTLILNLQRNFYLLKF